MSRPATTPTTSGLRHRVRSIQSNWSETKRNRRAVTGLRRSRELFAMLLQSTADEREIAAVGAATSEDWRRLAG